jgi:hypothetical protein
MNDAILISPYYDSIPDVMSPFYAINISIDTPRIHPQDQSYNVISEMELNWLFPLFRESTIICFED